MLPVEDEVVDAADGEGFDQEKDGGGQLHENEQVHKLNIWRWRNRTVYRG